MGGNKKYLKIGLSLLIALAFIAPASVIGVNVQQTASRSVSIGTQDAGDILKKSTTAPKNDDMMVQLPSDGPIGLQPGPVLPNGIFDPDFGPLYGDIPEGTYDLWTQLFIPEYYGPGAVKVFLECYKKGCGEEIVMYETSFEDNFDIYNNWVQIDADSGLVGGQYDSWTHSDARASDGDYSFKCSMYDIYKGNQDDYFECTKSFDVSEQNAVNVSFDIWVDGSGAELPWGITETYEFYTAYDYLDFEVSDDILSAGDIWVNPDNWYGLLPAHPDDDMIFVGSAEDSLYPGAYKFFDTTIAPYNPTSPKDYTPKVKDLGGGWWHVWYEVDIPTLEAYGFNTEDIMFRFSWHSDPENQFEGAYVDNFKVVSIEGVEEKVFQTHTQGPLYWQSEEELDDHILYVDFPLDWEAINYMECGKKTTCYDFKLWLQVVEGDYYTDYDWPDVVDIPICVGDYYDACVTMADIETSFGGEPIIPGPGIVEAGEDMHLTAWAHSFATIPVYDVPVKAEAYKKEWETIYSEDFEGLVQWEFGHFGDFSTQWHKTSTDAYGGSNALGCFDENTNHYKNDIYVDYAIAPPTVDESEYLELTLEYYTKYITEGANDYWAIMLSDPATNYVLGNIAGVGFATNGYQPNWIGPNQPAGKYQNFDVKAAYDYWYNVRGMFRNADGSQSHDVGFGFAFWASDADGYTNAQAEADEIYWSGLYFDDVKLKGLALSEEPVWQDVIIIPEMEPCEIYEVQFEWEDLPYSNYLIRVDANPEGECKNTECPPWEAQILVVSNKEKMHPKEVESIDLTGEGGGEWVISSSDTDNYIATNSDVLYEPNQGQVLQLCPNHEGDCECGPGEPCCMDISQQLADGVDVHLDFDAWWDLEGWPFDWVDLQIAFGCPCDKITDWFLIDSFDGWFQPVSSYLYEPDDGWVTMSDAVVNGAPYDIDALCTLFGETSFCLRFVFQSDEGWNFRGMKLDDITITNLFYDGFPPEYSDFEDPCDNLDNWCLDIFHTGQYWFHKYDRTMDPADIGTYCNFWDENNDGIKDPLESTIPNMNDALVWTTEVTDCYQAWLALEVKYQFENNEDPTSDHGYIEIDDGSGTWWKLDNLVGDSGGVYETRQYDISFLAGKNIQVRFRLVTDGDSPVACDHWCVKNVHIVGKQDHQAPYSTIQLQGTKKDGWYNTAVNVEIQGFDDLSGVREIHYILDGSETVVTGDEASFTVSGNGEHTLEFWAVDNVGNEEIPHHTVTFKIDTGAAPTVSITEPTPGIYIMGNKLLELGNKPIIFGGFTIEASASDADSGVYRVSFYLDDEFLGDDTEAPYALYCGVKHMGAGTLKVVAEDFAQNTAEDTLDITYFKLF